MHALEEANAATCSTPHARESSATTTVDDRGTGSVRRRLYELVWMMFAYDTSPSRWKATLLLLLLLPLLLSSMLVDSGSSFIRPRSSFFAESLRECVAPAAASAMRRAHNTRDTC